MSTDRDISISDTLEQPQATDIAISDYLLDLHGFEAVPHAQYAPLDGLAPGSAEAQARQRQLVERIKLPLEIKTRGTGIVLRLIPPGEFMMGSPKNEYLRTTDEQLHRVTITQPFYIGAYQVTQGQWRKVTGSNPSRFKEAGDDAPVERVSWKKCQAFLYKLEELEGLTLNRLRLPTEAEWEYACRAGTATAFCFGVRLDSRMANFAGSYPYGGTQNGVYRRKTTPVGSFQPNGWGLYDMHGNVSEWCQDWYGQYTGDATDPTGPASGSGRVMRGGCWGSCARFCRSAHRSYNPDIDMDFYGLRVCLPAGQ